MNEPIQIVRCHVDFEGRQIVIQCRRYDEATGTYLPLPPNMIRHVMPVNQDLLDEIERDVRPFLERDLSEVADASPEAVTSALHHLREARSEADRLRRQSLDEQREHQARVAAARAEHEELVRRRTIEEETLAELIRGRAGGR